MNSVSSNVNVDSDDAYTQFEKLVEERVAAMKGTPLFTTNAEGLWETYLSSLPANRQHYNCHACRRFIEKYGGLVTIDKDGGKEAMLWWYTETHRVPDFFNAAYHAMLQLVYESKVVSPFLSSDAEWGVKKTIDWKREGVIWSHLHGRNPNLFKHTSLLSAEQAMAEKREDHGMLCRALTEFSLATATEAARILSAGDALDRSEKVLGVARWFLDLHQSLAGKRGAPRDNLIWLAVAQAPPGSAFCHVRSSMIGTLLEDIQVGMAYDTIKSRWAAKMHPLQYQRPQAPPKAGNIAGAEKAVEALRSSGSLSRRFARLEDVLAALWLPMPPRAIPAPLKGIGVFSHLLPQEGSSKKLSLPTVTMTWKKFQETVLPSAHSIEYLVPSQPNSYIALVTAVDPNAPPILQWDGLEATLPDEHDHLPRNPVSWYYCHGGSPASRWGLTPSEWTKVNLVCRSPHLWQRPELFAHHEEAVIFLLNGAWDRQHRASGGFFVECLKSEYHAHRSVLEAYMMRAEIAGREEATACGVGLGKGSPGWQCTLRVDGDSTYKLDRWD